MSTFNTDLFNTTQFNGSEVYSGTALLVSTTNFDGGAVFVVPNYYGTFLGAVRPLLGGSTAHFAAPVYSGDSSMTVTQEFVCYGETITPHFAGTVSVITHPIIISSGSLNTAIECITMTRTIVHSVSTTKIITNTVLPSLPIRTSNGSWVLVLREGSKCSYNPKFSN